MNRNAIALLISVAALSGCATTVAPPAAAPRPVGLTPAECYQAHIEAQAGSRLLLEALPACERKPGLTEACHKVAILGRILTPMMQRATRCLEAKMPPPNLAEAGAMSQQIARRTSVLADRLEALQ